MGNFIYFTEEQIERANAVSVEDILRMKGEQMVRSGDELRWKRHDSVTIRKDCWYRHSERIGSHAIDFMQEFYNMTFPEAVTYLLDGETGQAIQEGKPEKSKPSKTKAGQPGHTARPLKEKPKEPPKEMILPEKNDTVKRVYAYLTQKRHIAREVISFFVRGGTIYESKGHHNIVFLGLDRTGGIRHAHQKGTYSEGNGFRINTEGADPHYGFGHVGKSERLYVFEAPIDFLSFVTLYPHGWQEHSYIVLNGVAEHAMLRMLADYPYLRTAVLCLDHDPAGIEACGRLAEILLENGHKGIKVLQPANKDWNEDLKQKNGTPPIPAKEHPKILECRAWLEILKDVCRDMDQKYAAKEYLAKYYRGIYDELKSGPVRERLADAFDGNGLLLSGIAVKCIETYSRAMGREITTDEIISQIGRRYYPHRDKGGLKSRIARLQEAFEEAAKALSQSDLPQKQNLEPVIRKCMGLTMECVKAHLFAAASMQPQVMEGGMEFSCSQ